MDENEKNGRKWMKMKKWEEMDENEREMDENEREMDGNEREMDEN